MRILNAIIYCIEYFNFHRLINKKGLMKMKNNHAKRVDIVSLKMIREGSILYGNRRIHEPDDVLEIFEDLLESSDREKLIVCCLNSKNEPTNISVVSIGSLNSSIVHPREVFKTAIISNAASIIIAHNHPSGDITPSKEDIDITERLKNSGQIIGIQLLDHLIIGNGKCLSLKEEGYL